MSVRGSTLARGMMVNTGEQHTCSALADSLDVVLLWLTAVHTCCTIPARLHLPEDCEGINSMALLYLRSSQLAVIFDLAARLHP